WLPAARTIAAATLAVADATPSITTAKRRPREWADVESRAARLLRSDSPTRSQPASHQSEKAAAIAPTAPQVSLNSTEGNPSHRARIKPAINEAPDPLALPSPAAIGDSIAKAPNPSVIAAKPIVTTVVDAT